MMDPSSGMGALAIFLAGSGALLGFAVVWRVSSQREPRKRRIRLTGRRATPYRHGPNQMQDERGISTDGQ